MKQWMDRQVYANKAVLSRATASTLRDGPGNHVWQFPTDSMLSTADDGADQAKFKTPHATGTKVHALAKFPRLPIHVQGLWAHGFGLQVALGSVDIPKDSFTNIEMLSRLLDSILTKYGSLPINLALQQDNCPRDCKTQTMMKWCATLVLHDISDMLPRLPGKRPRAYRSGFRVWTASGQTCPAGLGRRRRTGRNSPARAGKWCVGPGY